MLSVVRNLSLFVVVVVVHVLLVFGWIETGPNLFVGGGGLRGMVHQYLDENKQLILAILDNQNLGKINECAT